MSIYNVKNAVGELSFEGFSGMDARGKVKQDTISDIVNMHRYVDGSLETRCGFLPLLRLPEKPKAIFSGYVGGVFRVYAYVGKTVYRIFVEEQDYQAVGSTLRAYDRVSFFLYDGGLFMTSGEGILQVTDDGLCSFEAYIPLYGNGWSDGEVGPVYEPLNLLTYRARIRYVIGSPPTMLLATKHPVASVEAVFVNGELRSSDTYRIDTLYHTVNVQDLEAGDEVEIFLTYQQELFSPERLYENPYSTVFGGVSRDRVFLWGGRDPACMYASAPVTLEELDHIAKVCQGVNRLYFPMGRQFRVGGGTHAITAVSRHSDRLLIFTEGETWMADAETADEEETPLMRINTGTGCTSLMACVRCGNDPVCVSGDGIYRFTSHTDELDECNAYRISEPIDSLLDTAFFRCAAVMYDPYHRELLFRQPTEQSGEVWVYAVEHGCWTRFRGIFADFFFDGGVGLGFVSGSDLYLFDDALREDRYFDGTSVPIEGEIALHPEDMGMNARRKRLHRIAVDALTEGGDVTCRWCSDVGESRETEIKSRGLCSRQWMNARVNSERGTQFSLSLYCEKGKRQRIYGLRLLLKW